MKAFEIFLINVRIISHIIVFTHHYHLAINADYLNKNAESNLNVPIKFILHLFQESLFSLFGIINGIYCSKYFLKYMKSKKICESCYKFYSSRFTFLVPIVYIVYFFNWLLFLHSNDKIILAKFKKTLIYNLLFCSNIIGVENNVLKNNV